MDRVDAFLVGLLLMCPAMKAESPAGEAKEKQRASLRKQLDDALEARKWEEAAVALRKLQPLSAAKEKSELEEISTRLSAEKEWEKIQKEDPSAQPRKLAARLEAFLKRYGKDPELRTRAEGLRKKTLAEIYCTLEDFEKDHEDLDPDLVRIQDTGKVKQGKFAARWVSSKKSTDAIFVSTGNAHDWTRYAFLVLWIYSEKPAGRLTIDATSGGDNYYEAWNNIDWTGWKEVRIPLRGKESRFHKMGKPDWASIESLRLWKDKVVPVQIIIDDIRLERGS